MTTSKASFWEQIGPLEAGALVGAGVAVALVAAGRLAPVVLIILLVLGYFGYMARGVLRQARRFRPVEPPRAWMVTVAANLVLMAVGIGAFGWYMAGAGSRAWVPFLFFIAGMIALRQWRRGVVNRVYAWRLPALTLLQKGDYKRVLRELEGEATAGNGHPDKLAMVALAAIELNKLDRADELLTRARALAPDFASVNAAIGSLRRHQARYSEAVTAIQKALAFEDDSTTRYYLGLCQYLTGDTSAAEVTLRAAIADPLLSRQGKVYGAFLLGQIAETGGHLDEAQDWYARMAEDAPRVLPALHDEARRHKQTPYADTLKDHVRSMERLIARRSLTSESAPG